MMPNSQVTVTFSEKINPDSITITLQDTSADSSHTLTTFSVNNTTLQFTPEVMKFAATYALEIYATDMSDNPIDGNKDGIAGDPYKITAQTSTPALEIIRYFPVLLSFTREIIGDTTEFKFVTSADSVSYQWSADGNLLQEAVDSTLSFVFQVVKQYTVDVRVTDKFGTQAGLTWNITTKNTRTNFTVNLNDTTYTAGDTIIYDISATDPTILSMLELDWDGDGTIDERVENINATNYSGKICVVADEAGTVNGFVYATDMSGEKVRYSISSIKIISIPPYFSTDTYSLPTVEDEAWEYDFSPLISGNQSGIHYEVTSSNEEFVKITNVKGTKISGLNTGNYNWTMVNEEGNVVVYVKARDENNIVKDEFWLNIGEHVAERPDLDFVVKNLDDGIALAQDYVRLLDLNDNVVAEGYTDIEGKLNIQIESEGVYKLIYQKDGFYDREVGTVNVNADTAITEVRLNKTTFPMALLNEIARGGYTTDPNLAPGDVNRWVNKPLEIVINTNSDRSGSVVNDTTSAYEWAKTHMENEINPATVSEQNPDGFFYGVPVVMKSLPTKDYLSEDTYYDGKIMIQFVENLPSPALRSTKVDPATGEVVAGTIFLQAGLTPTVYNKYVKDLLHELACVALRTEGNSDHPGSIFSGDGRPDQLNQGDKNILKATYARQNKWFSNDRSL